MLHFNSSNSSPKVSVVMITYNHENYIEQAVRSVMMQETDFDYELLIGEDCSTDCTREIVVRLQAEFSDKIRLMLHPENVGIIPNFMEVFRMARGEYVAFLEGDDYWISPEKLQIQVDYMVANQDCMLCFHGFNVIFEDKPDLLPKEIMPLRNVPNRVDGHKSIQFGTLLLRRNRELPVWFYDLRASAEWPLITWVLMEGGKICPTEGPPMSVYRKHKGGVSSGHNSKRGLDKLNDYNVIRQNMNDFQTRHILFARLDDIHRYLYLAYICERDLQKARYHLLRYLYHCRLDSRRGIRKLLSGIFLYFRVLIDVRHPPKTSDRTLNK